MTPLSELMKRCRTEPGAVAIDTVGDDWMQGRSVFGGLQAAVGVRAMRTLVPDMPLRTLQMTFVAPVGADHVRAQARVLRAGRNATQVEARLGTADEALALLVAVFGAPRDSLVRRIAAPAAPLPPQPKLPFLRGIVPNFIEHFDVSLLEGAAPFAGRPVERVVYELGVRDAAPMSESHLLAIADFVPPVALSWMARPVPGSSVSWMLEILDGSFAGEPLQGWRVDAQMVAARDGYTNQSTTIHAPSGAAIALSRQSMVVFA